MRSYPDQVDSDGDGLTDDVDDRPLMVEFCEVAKLNSKSSDHYLNIVKNDGTTYYGGDQGWWEDKAHFQGGGNKLEEQVKLELDKYYRLWHMGCGTIAMSDADFQQTGLCKEDAYIDYIEKLYDKKYKISDNIVNRNTGLYPWKMERGFSDFLSTNSSSSTNVKWARYNKETYIAEKQKIVDEIERMLQEDIPVVFSYNTFKEDDGIRRYVSLENAKNDIATNNDRTPGSHYMTVIGLYKYASDQPLQYKYILEVVSWRQVYYIDYDMYEKNPDYFSNILSVY